MYIMHVFMSVGGECVLQAERSRDENEDFFYFLANCCVVARVLLSICCLVARVFWVVAMILFFLVILRPLFQCLCDIFLPILSSTMLKLLLLLKVIVKLSSNGCTILGLLHKQCVLCTKV